MTSPPPAPKKKVPTAARPTTPTEFITSLVRLLEQLMTRAWLETQPSASRHPAVVAHRECVARLAANCRIRSHDDIVDQLRLFALAAQLIQATDGDIHALQLGQLEAYGDARVQDRLRGVLGDPDKFAHVVTEFNFSAWFRDKAAVTPTEEEGLADFLVRHNSWRHALAVDAKHIERGTAAATIAAHIKKANKQIKNAAAKEIAPVQGLVFLDITDYVGLPLTFTDVVPPPVLTVLEVARKALATKNTSVGGALVAWNEYTIMGQPGQSTNSTAFLIRKSVLVLNPTPRVALEASELLTSYGSTWMIGVNWSAPVPGDMRSRARAALSRPFGYMAVARRTDVTASLASGACHWLGTFGIRTAHATHAAEHPDLLDSIAIGGQRAEVLVRRVPSSIPYWQLLVCHPEGDDRLAIMAGFKVYDDLPDLPREARPMQMLKLLASEFGVPAEIGSEVSLLFATQEIPLSGPKDMFRWRGEEGGQYEAIYIGRTLAGPPPVVQCLIAFVIDVALYARWLSAHR